MDSLRQINQLSEQEYKIAKTSLLNRKSLLNDE